MKSKQANQYQPDRASHPSETLLEAMESRGLTHAALARHMDLTVDGLDAMIAGAENITIEAAHKLERALAVPYQFWLARAKQFRKALRQ